MKLIEEARKLTEISRKNRNDYSETLEKQWKKWLSTELSSYITRVASRGYDRMVISFAPQSLIHNSEVNLSSSVSSYVVKMCKAKNNEKLVNDIKEVIGGGFKIDFFNWDLNISWHKEK